MLHAVIMAGGAGTRFWPLSRRQRPKQLLPLWGGRTLLELTVERLAGLIPSERVLIVAGGHLKSQIAAVLPALPLENIVVEPAARNTLPCVGLAAEIIARRDPKGVMSVFAADHFVRDLPAFHAVCRTAVSAAELGKIATLGIEPTHPETGYGYIQRADTNKDGAFDVIEFREKPNRETAIKYLQSGDYLWNAGIFFFQVETIRREIARQRPEMADALARTGDALAAGDQDRFEATFRAIESISVDYGVMENAEQVVVVPSSCGWSDVGQWAALDDVMDTSSGNIELGEVTAIDCDGCVLVQTGSEKLLAAVGLRDLVVVDTDDALLVLPKSQAQRVREIVAELRRSRPELL